MDVQKLKGYIVEKKKTYADCAKATNMSITSFSNKINGIYNFDVVEMNDLISFLEMPILLAIEIFLPFNLHITQEKGGILNEFSRSQKP